MLSTECHGLNPLLFWVREKAQSSAEIDFVIPVGKKIIPVEVKSGKTGTLRSLHSFIDSAEQNDVAIRLYAGNLSLDVLTTGSGKKFKLLNLPYYFSDQLHHWIETCVKNDLDLS